MLRTTIGRLRVAGTLEGVSFLVLLGIAMPLKYWFGYPEAVAVVGWLHGGLFVAYCLALYIAQLEKEWSIWVSLKYFVAALIPAGPFIMDRDLQQYEDGAAAESGAAVEEQAEETAEK